MAEAPKTSLRLVLALSLVLSVTSSAAISLFLRPRDNRPAKRQAPPAGAKRPDRLKAGTKVNGLKVLERELFTMDSRLEALREDVKGNAERLQGLQVWVETAVEPAMVLEDSPDEETLRRAVKNLIDVAGRASTVRLDKIFEDLIEYGNRVVPFLEAALVSNREGGGLVTGPRNQTHPRSRLINALCQIGTPEAKRAILRALSDPKTLDEMRTALSVYWDTRDPMMIQGLSPLLPMFLDRLRFYKPEATGREFFGYSGRFADAARNFGLTMDQEFMGRITNTVSGMNPKHRGFGDLVGLMVDVSPEETWRVFREKAKREENTAIGDLAGRIFLTLLRKCAPHQSVAFLRLVLADPGIVGSTRTSIYTSCRSLTWDRIETREDREKLVAVFKLLKERRSVEKDAGALERLDDVLRRFEARLR